jgi:hypothetical protein
MAQYGTKGQGQNARAKVMSIRHGHAPRRSCNAQEKAAESKVRQAGRQEVRRELNAFSR